MDAEKMLSEIPSFPPEKNPLNFANTRKKFT